MRPVRALKLPVRSRDELLSVKAALELAGFVDDPEDEAIVRETLLFFYEIGLRAGKSISVGQIEQLFEGFNADERRAMFDVAGLRAGLPSRKQVTDNVRFQAAQREALAITTATSPLQICAEPTCKAIPVDTIGLPIPVDVRRWWCDKHRHLAGEDDMKPRAIPPALRTVRRDHRGRRGGGAARSR